MVTGWPFEIRLRTEETPYYHHNGFARTFLERNRMSTIIQRQESTAELPLRDQWAVITGASKGIGLGIARAFVDAGAHVALVAPPRCGLGDGGGGLRGGSPL